MGYSPERVALMQKMSLFKGQAMAWLSFGGVIPMIGYMVYLRRFFWRRDSAAV
jgi:hypothetical protein